MKNKDLADDIRKLIYDKFYEKLKIDLGKVLVGILYFEEINEFLKKYSIEIDNLIDDSTEYKLQKKDYSLCNYLGKELKLVLKEENKSE